MHYRIFWNRTIRPGNSCNNINLYFLSSWALFSTFNHQNLNKLQYCITRLLFFWHDYTCHRHRIEFSFDNTIFNQDRNFQWPNEDLDCESFSKKEQLSWPDTISWGDAEHWNFLLTGFKATLWNWKLQLREISMAVCLSHKTSWIFSVSEELSQHMKIFLYINW